jgi:hypothetical protein
LLRHKLFNHGKIWCYRNPRYISGCFITFEVRKSRINERTRSGIKEFKNAAKEESSSDKKDETENEKKKKSRFKMRRNFFYYM